MSILVTGGTGYIGQKLVRALVGSGEEVHLLLRKESDRTSLEDARIHLFEGDILDRESVRRAAFGCECAYHLAAYARVWAPSGVIFHSYNVGGLRNVLESCGEAGVRRVVFTSSIVAMGPSSHIPSDERFVERTEFFTDYEHSKYCAEQEVTRYVNQGLEVVTVNPTRVYGPGKMTEANAVTRMLALYAKGKFPFLLSRGEHLGNYVFVDDVVQGHLLAMGKGRSGERYVLGGENASLRDFFDLVRDVTGIRRIQVPILPGLARMIGLFEEMRSRFLHIPPMISRGWVDSFLRHWAYSSKKAAEELGYSTTTLRLGLERTWEWLTNGPGRSVMEKL